MALFPSTELDHQEVPAGGGEAPARPTMRRLRSLSVLVVVTLAGLVTAACPPTEDKNLTVVLPLTGDYSLYGEAIHKGIELAAEEVQTANPELGLSIEVLDSESDPATGAAILEESITGAIAAIGGVTSAEALAQVEVADRTDRALLSPTASSPELSGISRNFFRIFPSADKESAILAGFVTNTLESDRLAILYQDDVYGEATSESFKNIFTGEVVAEVPFPIGGSSSEAVQAIVESDPEAVYVAAIGEDLATAIRELRAAGVDDEGDDKQWILTSSALVSPTVLASTGDAANRVFLAQTAFDATSEQEPVASFVAAYEAKYGEQPGYYAAHGYDVMKVAAEAASEMDSGLPGDFIKELRQISNFPGVTGSIQFREGGDVQKFTRVYWVVDGNPVDYDQFLQDRRDAIRKRQEELQRQLDRNSRELQEVGS